MKEHFCREMLKFVNEGNFVSLGKAIHPIQDAYSPAHNLNGWTGANYLPHLFESLLIYPHQGVEAVQGLRWLYREIHSSPELDNGRLGAAFDAWIWRYNNHEYN